MSTVRAGVRPVPTKPRGAGSAGGVVLVGAGAAWAALLVAGAAGIGVHAHGGWPGSPGGGVPELGAPGVDPWTGSWLGGWLLMVVAMMWPLLAPAVDRVAASSFPRWRRRLVVVTVAVPTALWVAFGLVAASLAALLRVPAGSLWWQLAALVLAGAALRSARRARVLQRCSATPPVAPGGWRGVRGAVHAGAAEWRRCAVLCGPLMLAMAVGHSLVVLVPASIAVWWEAGHPRAWRDPVPLALVAVAALGAVGAAWLGA